MIGIDEKEEKQLGSGGLNNQRPLRTISLPSSPSHEMRQVALRRLRRRLRRRNLHGK